MRGRSKDEERIEDKDEEKDGEKDEERIARLRGNA